MNKFRIISAILVLALGGLFQAQAQNLEEEQAMLDSLNAFKPVMVDSTMVGKTIFNILPSHYNGHRIDVKIHQSKAIIDGMNRHLQTASERMTSGYRVRIYFDNKQDSRTDSEQTLVKFRMMYPEIPAYRSYKNPNFKVTVGDYRTKSEALFLLNRIKPSFPSAFVVKEEIQFPL